MIEKTEQKRTWRAKYLDLLDRYLSSTMHRRDPNGHAERVHAKRDRDSRAKNPEAYMPENDAGIFKRQLRTSIKEQGLTKDLSFIVDSSQIFPILSILTKLGLTQKTIENPNLLKSKGIEELIIFFDSLEESYGEPLPLDKELTPMYEKLFLEGLPIGEEINLDSPLNYDGVSKSIANQLNGDRKAELARFLLQYTQNEEVKEILQPIIDQDDQKKEREAAYQIEQKDKKLKVREEKSPTELKAEEEKRLNLVQQGISVVVLSLSEEKKNWLYKQVLESTHVDLFGKIEESEVLSYEEREVFYSLTQRGGIDSIIAFGMVKLILKEQLGVK